MRKSSHKPRRPRPKAKPKPARTQKALAQLLDISPQLVNKHVRSGKAPPIDDIAAWEEFLTVNGRAGSMPAELRSQIAKERHRILTATADRLEDERARRRGSVYDAATVDNFLRDLIGDVFADLRRVFQTELPPVLKGLDEAAIAAKAVAELETISEASRNKLIHWQKTQRST